MIQPLPTDPALDVRDLRVVSPKIWRTLESLEAGPDFQILSVWELPTRRDIYSLGVDVSDGIGGDRSVIDVVRHATIERPFEQVAQYVSRYIDPVDLAYVVDSVGRFYSDPDQREAQVAVEINSHGIATQSELERHLGYSNFYIWQWEDAAPGSNRYTRKIGWVTSRRTRPILITRYWKAVTTIDPTTGQTDLVVNSSFTIDEMRDFQTEGPLHEAVAAPGAFDDCIMAGAIGYFVAQQRFFEGGETIAEQRRRLAWLKERQKLIAERRGQARDFINTDCTVEELMGYDS